MSPGGGGAWRAVAPRPKPVRRGHQLIAAWAATSTLPKQLSVQPRAFRPSESRVPRGGGEEGLMVDLFLGAGRLARCQPRGCPRARWRLEACTIDPRQFPGAPVISVHYTS